MFNVECLDISCASITIPRHAPRPPMIKTAGLVGFAGPAAESPILVVWVSGAIADCSFRAAGRGAVPKDV